MIETPRLILREYTDDDFAELHRIVSDPVTMSFWPEPFSEDKSRQWIGWSVESHKNRGFGRLAMILKETNEFIGDAGFGYILVNEKPENDLGYIVAKEHWRRGYGTEAAIACRDYGFNELNFTRIVANMAFDNVPSRLVAEKAGMTKETEFYNSRNRGILTLLYSLEKKHN